MTRPDSQLIEERTALGRLAGADTDLELTSRLAEPGAQERTHTGVALPPPLPATKPSPKGHLVLVSAQATEDVVAERPSGTLDNLRPARSSTETRRRPHFGPRTLAEHGADQAAELPPERPRRDLTRPKAILPGVALPPPTEYELTGLGGQAGVLALDESSYHQLRRDESVIAAAYAARSSPLARAKSLFERARSSLKEGSYNLTGTLGETGIGALQRFEQLPRSRQLLLVAAPYVGALVLVLVLLQVRGQSAEALPPPVAPVVPAQVAAATTPPPAAPAPEPAIVAPPRTHALQVVKRVLLDKTILLGRPDQDGPQVVKLRAGTGLNVYPEFPTPNGWVMVQSDKGTVGFLEETAFDRSAPAPKAEPVRKAKKHRRRR